MKKINLFNRNTNLPSYRGTGPRKNVPSFRGNAESPRCCRELVCGKTDGIPLFSGMTKKICHKFPSREGWRVAPAGVWFAALVALFVATPSFATPTELDKKTVASKAYVDTKQDIIETGNVLFYDDPEGTQGDVYVPGLVAYDSQTSTLSGNKIGILDWQTADDVGGFLEIFSYEGGGYGSEMDNYVPTVRAVAESLSELHNIKQNKLPEAWTSTTGSYNMASMGGETIDLKTTPGRVGHRYITAGGSQPLTKKSGADNVILYINGTKTLAQYQTSNFGGTGGTATTNQNYIKGALVSLELLKDVYSALHNEIQNATPTGTPGNVAMYDPSTGALGDGVATYDGSTTYNASTDADKIAVMSGVQRKKECGGYEPGHENDPDYCWLWIFPD